MPAKANAVRSGHAASRNSISSMPHLLRSRRGQAAITDALYFLLIVTGLCVFLFGFANSYGGNALGQIQSNYQSDFATDSLKTILYSSLPRNVGHTLYDDESQAEIDYLLAYVKEDYADDANLSMQTRVVLADNVRRILEPVSDNFDYIFVMRIPFSINNDKRDFVYLYMKKTNFRNAAQSSPRPSFRPVADDADTLKDESVSHYLCGLGNSAEYGDLQDHITTDILRVVGTTNQVSSKVLLAKSTVSGFEEVNNPSPTASSSAFPDYKAQADIIMWNSTILKDYAVREENGTEYFMASPWCCVEIESFSNPDVTAMESSIDPTCITPV